MQEMCPGVERDGADGLVSVLVFWEAPPIAW